MHKAGDRTKLKLYSVNSNAPLDECGIIRI